MATRKRKSQRKSKKPTKSKRLATSAPATKKRESASNVGKKRDVDLLPISAFVVLPFRGTIAPFEASFVCASDSDATEFQVAYSEALQIAPDRHIASGAWTQVTVKTHFPVPNEGPSVDAVWFMSDGNGTGIIDREVLPRVNELLLRMKCAAENKARANVLRPVGAVDLVFANLHFRDEVVFARVNDTWMATLAAVPQSTLVLSPEDLASPVSQEWAILVRATDLVNHGFYLEGFVAAFALLDACVQDFVRLLLNDTDLAASDAQDLLRSIESDRLRRYLGLLLPLLRVASPLADSALASELKWLNKTRNSLMHAGRPFAIRHLGNTFARAPR